MSTTPDLRWYSAISENRHVPIRCPHAQVGACPRYFQSLDLLKHAGCTAIPEKDSDRLLKRWKESDLWPLIDEQATSVNTSGNRTFMYCNFCPEVLHDRFGYFATFLAKYVDEIDMEAAHSALSRMNAPSDDPRWVWMDITPQHYTECPLYSVITYRGKPTIDIPWWREHLAQLIIGLVLVVATAIAPLILG